MDERELANRLLDLADRTAYENGAQRVVSIHLSIGGSRCIDPTRLVEMFEAVAHGTVAEGAALKVNVLPVRHHCQNCGADFDGSAKDLPCPECEHPHTELMGGEEIRVLEVQVDDNAA